MAETDITMTVENLRSNRQIQLLRKLLNDPEVIIEINTIIKDAINQYVPMESGDLRASAEVTEEQIVWGGDGSVPYAHYQHEGITYGPNIPIHAKGDSKTIIGWYSPKGEGSKFPNGMITGFGLLGTAGSWNGWNFGYTTDSPVQTTNHWIDRYAYELKYKTNQLITKRLKEICKERGIIV